MSEKEKVISLIEKMNDRDSIHYIYQLIKDFICRYSSVQIYEQSEGETLPDLHEIADRV